MEHNYELQILFKTPISEKDSQLYYRSHWSKDRVELKSSVDVLVNEVNDYYRIPGGEEATKEQISDYIQKFKLID